MWLRCDDTEHSILHVILLGNSRPVCTFVLSLHLQLPLTLCLVTTKPSHVQCSLFSQGNTRLKHHFIEKQRTTHTVGSCSKKFVIFQNHNSPSCYECVEGNSNPSKTFTTMNRDLAGQLEWHSLPGGSSSSCPDVVSLRKALDSLDGTLIKGLYAVTTNHEMRIPFWLLNTP